MGQIVQERFQSSLKFSDRLKVIDCGFDVSEEAERL